MTREEFNLLCPGDRVRIVDKRRGAPWNSRGLMDHWLGQVMTVKEGEDGNGTIKFEEDQEENGGDGWYWMANMIECRVYNERIPEVGDRVLLVPYLTAGAVEAMRPYLGTVQTVCSVDPDGLFCIDANPGWVWSSKYDIAKFVDEERPFDPVSDETIIWFLGFKEDVK